MQNKASLILMRLTNYRRFSTTKVFAKAGQTEDQSAANRYCTASGLDGILLC